MSSILKGAMIGCGWFAENHREAWQRIPGVEIVAAADQRLERAQRFASRAYASAEELLDREEVDFVDIVTHAASHLPLVRLAIEKADTRDLPKADCTGLGKRRATGQGRGSVGSASDDP